LKSLLRFINSNRREVLFGGGLTFISSFGQTFLISLYVPEILKTFGISNGGFGSIYAFATVIASVAMLSLGHTIDHKPVKKVTAITLIGLIVSLILLGLSHFSIAILIISLIGLRLTGQGLMSHISLTVMSRHYVETRGKALSTASLGYAVGEAVFPIIISSLILWYNYEVAAFASAGFLFLYLIRLYFIKLDHFDRKKGEESKPTSRAILGEYKKVILTNNFWIIMPLSFFLGFTITAIFFYQYVFVEAKGWSISLYAAFFTAYAITRFIFAVVGGLWVDRFTAKKVFRLFLIPISLGLIPFALMKSIIGALFFLICAGITTGIAGTVKTAVLAETFGTKKLGTVRSLFSMFMVLSTALGPLVIGLLLDGGFSFQMIMLWIAAVLFLVILNAQRIK